jgi:hypothetical protein
MLDLARAEPAEQRGEVGDATLTTLLHHAPAPCGRMKAVDTAVALVADTPHQAVCLEALDDPRHRRRPNLLGGRQLAKRARPPEHEHGQSRELRRRNPGRRILPPHVPQGVDRGRVEAIGGLC